MQDFHEPSIAVNAFDHVAIGYTCSGPNLAASACVSVGETMSGVTTFEWPQILAMVRVIFISPIRSSIGMRS